MTVGQQAQALAAMAVCGAALGAACDALGLLRRALRAGRVMTAMLDLLWGVLSAAAVVAVGLWLRIDVLRGYVLAGVAAGIGAYALIVGLPARRMARTICEMRKKTENRKTGKKKDEKQEKETKKGRKTANRTELSFH